MCLSLNISTGVQKEL